MPIDQRALGACVLACTMAAAWAAPAETNWDALSSAGWRQAATADTAGDSAGDAAGETTVTTTEATGGAAGVEAPTAGQPKGEAVATAARPAGSEIAQAFVKLGMHEARATCFGEILAKQLSPDEQREAARIVGDSKSADDVKTNVITSGPAMVGGFSAADAACPEGMGS